MPYTAAGAYTVGRLVGTTEKPDLECRHDRAAVCRGHTERRVLSCRGRLGRTHSVTQTAGDSGALRAPDRPILRGANWRGGPAVRARECGRAGGYVGGEERGCGERGLAGP